MHCGHAYTLADINNSHRSKPATCQVRKVVCCHPTQHHRVTNYCHQSCCSLPEGHWCTYPTPCRMLMKLHSRTLGIRITTTVGGNNVLCTFVPRPSQQATAVSTSTQHTQDCKTGPHTPHLRHCCCQQRRTPHRTTHTLLETSPDSNHRSHTTTWQFGPERPPKH
jgi:hypothetical protein